MSSRKYHCTRCGSKLEKSAIESNNDRVVAYCYSQAHKPIRFHILIGFVRRTIRSERIQSNKEIDELFNLSKLKCICGSKYYPDRGGVSHHKGITKGMCLAKSHRVEIEIRSKIYLHEPAFHELQEISTKPMPDFRSGSHA